MIRDCLINQYSPNTQIFNREREGGDNYDRSYYIRFIQLLEVSRIILNYSNPASSTNWWPRPLNIFYCTPRTLLGVILWFKMPGTKTTLDDSATKDGTEPVLDATAPPFTTQQQLLDIATASAAAGSESTISHVSVKLPPFWRSNCES